MLCESDTDTPWVQRLCTRTSKQACVLLLQNVTTQHTCEAHHCEVANWCAIHKNRALSIDTTKSIDGFVRSKSSSQEDQVTAAEVTSVYHTVQHSTSYRAGKCGSKLAPAIFPDSDIARRMACGRTKAEAIIQDVLAPASVQDCLKSLTDKGIVNKHYVNVFWVVSNYLGNVS